MENTKNEPRSIMYLFYAMIAFLFLGLEFGVLFISRLIDGRSMSQIGNWPIHWYGAIGHWILTMIVWLIGVYLITMWAKKKDVLNQLVDFTVSKKTIYLIILAVGIALISACIQLIINDHEIPQIYQEYKGFVTMYANHAFIVTLFQVLYYIVEMVLVFIMIVLFQRFGEDMFKNKRVPYGSIGLMLTWGMIHFVSHPAGALYVTLWALVPGVLYVFGGKRFLPVYLLLVLGFIL